MRATSKKELSFQYFQFYTAAFLRSIEIRVLSMEARDCYVHLISHQWEAHVDDRAHLPLDPNHLRALTPASPAQWRDIWPEIEGLFPIADDQKGRRNPAIYANWLETLEFRAKQSRNGKNGGRPSKPKESQDKPTGSAEDTETKPTPNPTESGGFPVGSSSVSEKGQNGKPNESSKLLAVVPLSPPPSGGGASPAASGRVLPFGKANSNSAPNADPFAGPSAISLDALLEVVPESSNARGAIAELLEDYSKPHKWGGWMKELTELATKETSSIIPVPWESIGQGLRELLLINPEGQRIGMSAVETFARNAMRRRLRAEIDPGVYPEPVTPKGDQFAEYAARQASNGDPEYIAYCTNYGIAFTRQETA